jgi:hypothetical protein
MGVESSWSMGLSGHALQVGPSPWGTSMQIAPGQRSEGEVLGSGHGSGEPPADWPALRSTLGPFIIRCALKAVERPKGAQVRSLRPEPFWDLATEAADPLRRLPLGSNSSIRSGRLDDQQ